jgi:hypothetical protein
MSFSVDRHPYHVDIFSTNPRRMLARVHIFASGYPHSRFPVCDAQGQFLFSVLDVEEGLAELEKSLSNYEAPWLPIYSDVGQQGLPMLFIKRTPFGELRVEATGDRRWIALRDGLPLRQDDRDAIFASCGYAQHVAELHMRDYFNGLRPPPDDLRWLYAW